MERAPNPLLCHRCPHKHEATTQCPEDWSELGDIEVPVPLRHFLYALLAGLAVWSVAIAALVRLLNHLDGAS